MEPAGLSPGGVPLPEQPVELLGPVGALPVVADEELGVVARQGLLRGGGVALRIDDAMDWARLRGGGFEFRHRRLLGGSSTSGMMEGLPLRIA